MRKTMATMMAISVGAWLIGCATVAPYERETLARRDMQFEQSSDSSAGASHATAYREGSSGAEGSSGGGCGCN